MSLLAVALMRTEPSARCPASLASKAMDAPSARTASVFPLKVVPTATGVTATEPEPARATAAARSLASLLASRMTFQ